MSIEILGYLKDDRQWTNKTLIRSASGNKYTIARRKSDHSLGCSCKGFINHRHCKHIDAYKKKTSIFT